MPLSVIQWIASTHEEEKNQTEVSFPLFRGHGRKSETNHFSQYIPKYFGQANVRSASFQYFGYGRGLTNLIRKFQNGIESERYIVDLRNQSGNVGFIIFFTNRKKGKGGRLNNRV